MNTTQIQDWLPMPKEWIGMVYNACTDPCDMLYGPCACGAWHELEEWVIKRKETNMKARNCVPPIQDWTKHARIQSQQSDTNEFALRKMILIACDYIDEIETRNASLREQLPPPGYNARHPLDMD